MLTPNLVGRAGVGRAGGQTVGGVLCHADERVLGHCRVPGMRKAGWASQDDKLETTAES